MGALAFNARVLEMATHADVPLLERLRYLCIVSSNLDEFFEIRVSDTLDVNVFRFEFQVVPQDKKKAELEFASGPSRRLVKQWGEGS